MAGLVRELAWAIPTGRVQCIEGASHAAPFDVPATFVELIADTISSSRQ